MYATLENETPSLIAGPIYLHDEVQHLTGGFHLWSDEELLAVGVYRVHTTPVPENFEQTGSELVWTGERVESRPTGVQLTDEDVANRRREDMRLSFAQLLIGLVTEQWITSADGRAWRDRTALPPAVAGLIATLPPEQQFAAETRAMAFTEALRLDPLVEALGAAEGKTPEELDTFFSTYANV
jgi:hypothetical protein